MLVEMKPEFGTAFKKSKRFSSINTTYLRCPIAEKGKSAFLLKGSAHVKRKRSEMDEVKEEETLLH